MSDEGRPQRRRRRRRATRSQGAPGASAESAASAESTPSAESAASAESTPFAESAPSAAVDPAAGKPTRRRRAPRDFSGERGLRDLVGAGPSQVGVSGALRARDVHRPSEDDLAEAERELVIVRRNWTPPDG